MGKFIASVIGSAIGVLLGEKLSEIINKDTVEAASQSIK